MLRISLDKFAASNNASDLKTKLLKINQILLFQARDYIAIKNFINAFVTTFGFLDWSQ